MCKLINFYKVRSNYKLINFYKIIIKTKAINIYKISLQTHIHMIEYIDVTAQNRF